MKRSKRSEEVCKILALMGHLFREDHGEIFKVPMRNAA